MYDLRLGCGDLKSAPFCAGNAGTLKRHLQNVFVDLAARGAKSAVLEVRHPIHGWRQVCGRDEWPKPLPEQPSFFDLIQNHYAMSIRYPIIKNPLAVDHERLILFVRQTLAECDQLPTEAEKAAMAAKRRAERSDEIAKRRRDSFRLV